jgi:LuxR family maltose regulon positive regulatory protein
MSSPFRDAAAVTLDASHRVGHTHASDAPVSGRFHPPSAIKGLVPRPRLHQKLTASTTTEGSGPGSVGLLSAPAGAGKTLLLANWAREYSRASPDVDLAWLTLAERDNNVSVLCESLAEAISTPLDPAGRAPTGQGFPAQAGSRRPVEQWLAHFAETVEAHDRRTTLILDDVHTLHDPMSIGLLDQILTHTPDNLSIIVAARYEPPLTWHRLALDGRLTRFASTDLAFDRTEITAMFGEYDIALGDDELAIVENFTKGWGAVVRLTAAFLAGRSDIGDALNEFTHTPRPIADFLVDEVLTSLPEHVTTFMLRTSVVDSFSAQLAETLTDSNARSEIDALIQYNFPVTRTDSTPFSSNTSAQSSVGSITRREIARTFEQQPGSRVITSNSRRSNSRCRSATRAASSLFSRAADWASYSTGTAETSSECSNPHRRRSPNLRSPAWSWLRPPSIPVT